MQAIGKVNIRIPVQDVTHINLSIDVINMDIPLIIGLDMLRSYRLLVNYINDTIHFGNFDIKRTIKHKSGHVFLECNLHEILFTRKELVRLHTHFMHPSASRLFSSIARADTTKPNSSIQHLFEEITSACLKFQPYKSAPLRFKVSIPNDKILFNQMLSIDLLWLYERPVLRIIDEETGFRNASFLRSKSADDIYNAFLGCWVSIYVVFLPRYGATRNLP